MSTTVTWHDDDGDEDTMTITDDFVVVVDGTAHLDGVTRYANGTYVLTVKGGPKSGDRRG